MNHTNRFKGSATVSDLAIRPKHIHVWHRPDRLLSSFPHQPGTCIRPIAHVVNLSDGDNRFVRCSDLFHILVPDIDNALLGDEFCRLRTASYSAWATR